MAEQGVVAVAQRDIVAGSRLVLGPGALENRANRPVLFPEEAGAVLGEYNKNSANPMSKLFEAMRDAGAVTIAQDEQTSVVFGMPRAAIEGGAARQVLPVTAIGQTIAELLAPRGHR